MTLQYHVLALIDNRCAIRDSIADLAVPADLDRLEEVQWILQMYGLLEGQVMEPQPFDSKRTSPWIRPFVAFCPYVSPSSTYR